MSVDDENDDFTEETKTKYAILINKNGGWFISLVEPNCEVGGYDADQNDARIAAFFDDSVERILRAMIEIGGDSIECRMQILNFLSGVCRGFVSAKEETKKWIKESAE